MSKSISRFVALFLSAGSVVATAQETSQSGDAVALDEVVVTARKTTEQLLDVPLAVTAFSSESIEARGIVNLDDVAAFTPGLTFSNVIGEFLPAPVIRGVAPIDIFGELNTALFLDGVYVAGREGVNFNQLDLERIEVVKGPQAALYGRNAFSGAINYVSAKPTDEFKAKTVLTGGSDGKKLASLTVSGPIGGGGLKGRATLIHDEWDGSYENQYSGSGRRETIGGNRFQTFTGALLWDVSETFSAELGAYLSKDNIDNSATSAAQANCEDRRVRDQNLGVTLRSSRLLNFCGELPTINANTLSSVPGSTGEDRRITRAHLKLHWDLANGATIEAISGYSRVTQDFLVDGTRNSGETTIYAYQPAPVVVIPMFGSSSGPLQRFTTGLLQIGGGDLTREFSQEIRFMSDREQALRYSVGAYYYDNEARGGIDGVIASRPLPANFGSFCLACTALGPTTVVDFAPGAGNAAFLPWFTDPVGGARFDDVFLEDSSAPSVFAAVEYDFTDRVTGSVDARYTDEDRSFLDTRTNVSGANSWGLTSWRGTLRFKPVSNVTWYAGIAHSEKSGDFDPTTVRLVTAPTVDVTLPGAFDKETLLSYELGVKAELLDRRVAINFDLYRLDWSDIVIPQVVSEINGQQIVTPVSFNVNAGEASVTGAELAIVARPARGVDLNLAFSYSDPKYDRARVDSFIDFPTFAPTGDISGNQILRTSTFQASAGAQVTRPVGNFELAVRGDITHRGKQFADASNQTIVPSSTNLNASIALRAESWSLELWGRNLTHEDAPTGAFRDVYFTNTLPNGFNSGGTFFPFRYTVSHPRLTTYGLTLRWSF